jgi:hypothetical protein
MMSDVIGAFSGRTLTQPDLEMIRWARASYPGLSRSELAGTICEFLEWVTPSGNAKTIQCLECLATLESAGLVDLPPLKAQKRAASPRAQPPPALEDMPAITACGDIQLAIASPGYEMRKWRGYVDAYHPLGCKTVFGSQIHYFIRSNQMNLGCLQFSACAWALQPRDQWIGWSRQDKTLRQQLVLNNSRFLLLPGVRVKNLASRALALAAKQIQSDWLNRYGYAPVLLETFVDSTAHKGISYRAANWFFLGNTKGRGRMDTFHKNHVSPKAIFVYPLQKDFKEVLLGHKPCTTQSLD